MKLPLTGVIPPMVTPLCGRDELDWAGLERLLEHILTGGVSGLFILGTTGEGPCLSYRLRRELIERTCRQVRGRVPVLVGITDSAFVESLSLAHYAATAGAAALVLAPPYYLPGSQQELRDYLEHIVAELPLPLLLYNVPTLTKVQYGMELLRWAIDQPRIIGLKDSSGNMSYFREAAGLLKHRPDWSLLIGPEELLAEAVLAGGHGGIPGGANLFPRLYRALYQAAHAGDLHLSQRLHGQVIRISDSLYHNGHDSASVTKGIKCALCCMGVCNDLLAEPFHRLHAEERARIQHCLPDLAEQAEELISNHRPGKPSHGMLQPQAGTEAIQRASSWA